MGFLSKLLPAKVKRVLNIVLSMLTKGKELGLFDQNGNPVDQAIKKDKEDNGGL